MNNPSSDTNLTYVPSPGKGRQIDEQEDRIAFISSWRQKVAEEIGHVRHVTEFFEAGQRGYQLDAVGTNEVSPLSLPCELRALPMVTSMSSLNVRGLDGGSAHGNLVLTVPIDAAMPPAELSNALPPAVAFPSPTFGIHHSSVNVVSVPRVSNTNPDSARVVVSASSQPPGQPSLSPGTHPTFAVFLEAALVKRARALTTETNDVNVTLLPPSTQRSSITPSSSRVPAHPAPPADCNHPQCIRATERIQSISRLQQAFALFNMAAHPITHDLNRASAAARRVLCACVRGRTIAAIRECLLLLHGIGGANNQSFHAVFYAACSRTGFDPATLPALTGVSLPPNWPQVHMHHEGGRITERNVV